MADAKLSALPAGGAIADADLFYSAQSGSSVKQPASAFRTYVLISGLARPQRLVSGAAGVITPAGTDQIININWTSGASGSYALPAASTRAGVPITFKDIGGTFLTRPLTINRSGSDTIEGLTSITLSNNFSAMTLTPCNDGTTANLWYIT